MTKKIKRMEEMTQDMKKWTQKTKRKKIKKDETYKLLSVATFFITQLSTDKSVLHMT
jgi:hypothetical protein